MVNEEPEERLRREIVEYSRRVHARGWVANHDGNLTARLGADGRLLCTPTAVSKGDVRPEWLIVVDANDKVIAGTRRPFGELQLHRLAYAARPDVGACIHAHPPTATGFAVAGVALEHPFLAEAVVSLGDAVPTVPFHAPGEPGIEPDLRRALQVADVVLLENHGVLVVGGSLEQAYLRLELVEHLARIALVARQLGGARRLPSAAVAALSAKGRPRSMPDHTPEGEAGVTPGYEPPMGERVSARGVVEDALRRWR